MRPISSSGLNSSSGLRAGVLKIVAPASVSEYSNNRRSIQKTTKQHNLSVFWNKHLTKHGFCIPHDIDKAPITSWCLLEKAMESTGAAVKNVIIRRGGRIY